jgi:hypothetical protein
LTVLIDERDAPMTLYADSDYPVRADIDAVHAVQLDRMAAPGTWGSGAQRRAVALAARRAGIDAGLLEASGVDDDAPGAGLPETVRRVVEPLAVSPGELDRDFYEQALADGLSDAEYVEIVGVVARMTDLDVFARGIDVPLRPLPAARPGAPTRQRSDGAKVELAWVPTVPNAPEGGELALSLYGDKPKPYIVRALSLVPDELRNHLELEQAQYTRLDRVLDFGYRHYEALTRPQVEIVAGRISALNACFF